MPKPRAPYLRKEITRHGRIVWYVRKTGQKRTRLRAPYGTDEFEREYAAAAGGAPVQVVRLARAAATKLMKPKAAPSEPEGRT